MSIWDDALRWKGFVDTDRHGYDESFASYDLIVKASENLIKSDEKLRVRKGRTPWRLWVRWLHQHKKRDVEKELIKMRLMR